LFLDVVKDESNIEVANTTNDYITIEVINVNGTAKASGSECVLEGLDINAVEDNIHATPRTNEGIINRNGNSKHNFVQQNYALKKVI
jgi:P pilus assembly chaperone PapD